MFSLFEKRLKVFHNNKWLILPMKNNTFIFSLSTSLLAILLSSCYAILSIIGRVPMSWTIFFSMLGILILFQLPLFRFFFRHRNELGLQRQIILILWLSIVLCYWLIGPVIYFLSMNVNEDQLRWDAFAYSWEVPVIGGLYILLTLFLLRPVVNFINGHSPSGGADRIYRRVMNFPLIVSIGIFIFSIFGYFIGALQLRFFADQSLFEQVKNTINGVVSAFFVAIFYYLFLDATLGKTRSFLEKTYNLKDTIKHSIVKKFNGVTFALLIGTTLLFNLLILQSSQKLVRHILLDQVETRMESISTLNLQSTTANDRKKIKDEFTFGKRGRVYTFAPQEKVTIADISTATQKRLTESIEGSFDDMHKDLKLLVLYKNPYTLEKTVSVIYMTDFYNPLYETFGFLGIVSIVVFILSAIVMSFLSISITEPIRKLSDAVKQAASNPDSLFNVHISTADELEELSHAFKYFVNQNSQARKELEKAKTNLEDTVQQRTSELKSKVAELEQLNKIMVGREVKMAEMKEKVERLTKENSTDAEKTQ